MRTIDRYITLHTLRSSLVVVGALLILISLFALFEELDEDRGTYGFNEAISYIMMTMPRRLDEILVYGLFLGFLIALGRLAETNELTICRVVGMSPFRIMLALLPTMVLWLAVSTAVSEFVAPQAERAAEAEKMQHLFGADALDRHGGLWVRTGPMFMRVRAIDDEGRIHGITQYHLGPDNRLTEIIQAESGTYDPVVERWNILDGTRTTLTEEQATTQSFRAFTWDNPITPEVLAAQAFLEANKMSLADLARQIEFAKTQQLGVSEYQLAYWARIVKPLTYIGLTLFALAVVLGPLRQVGMGVRLTFGIFAGLGFKYLQDLFAPAAIVFNIPALIAILIPIAVYWIVAIFVIRRTA